MNQAHAYHFVRLNIHKRTVAFCEKTIAGQAVSQGMIPARRQELIGFAQSRTRP